MNRDVQRQEDDDENENSADKLDMFTDFLSGSTGTLSIMGDAALRGLFKPGISKAADLAARCGGRSLAKLGGGWSRLMSPQSVGLNVANAWAGGAGAALSLGQLLTAKSFEDQVQSGTDLAASVLGLIPNPVTQSFSTSKSPSDKFWQQSV